MERQGAGGGGRREGCLAEFDREGIEEGDRGAGVMPLRLDRPRRRFFRTNGACRTAALRHRRPLALPTISLPEWAVPRSVAEIREMGCGRPWPQRFHLSFRDRIGRALENAEGFLILGGMLSQRAKYGLKALLALARQKESRPLLVAEIARQESIPKKFLEVILLQLKNQGIVRSKKGRGGGYLLLQPAEKVTFGQVIRILDGPLAPVPCASVTAYRKCEDCVDVETCEVRLVMRQVPRCDGRILDYTTLTDVARPNATRSDAAAGLADDGVFFLVDLVNL